MHRYFILAGGLCISLVMHAQVKTPANIQKQSQNRPPLTPTVQLITDTLRTITIVPASVSNLCPWQKTSGDNDFGKNKVSVAVNIHYVYNMRYGDTVLKANIALSGTEQGGDRTTVKGEWQKVVYRAPAGWKIKNISNEEHSLVTYFTFYTDVSQKEVKQGACIEMRYQLVPSNLGFTPSAPTVKDIKLAVHNTRADDFDLIESTCDCGFKIIKVDFKPLTVVLEKIR